MPLYCAAKHGIVGLTRALAKRLKTLGEPITVNCICPALVDTGIAQTPMAVAPPEYVTPKSTVVRAVAGFVDDDSLTGQVAECSGENIYYRNQPEWANDGSKYVLTGLEADIIKHGFKVEL